ncbi:MAG: AI-2E family transporter [Salibacteraceae bacterium]
MNMFEKKFDLDRVVRWIIALGIIVGAYFLLRRLSNVLLPFFLAWFTAYMLHPMVSWTQRWIKNRIAATLVTLTAMLLLLIGLSILLVPMVVDEFRHFYALLSTELSNMNMPEWISQDLLMVLKERIDQVNLSNILKQSDVKETLSSGLSAIWSTITGAFGVLGVLFGTVTYFLYLVFILIDYEDISEGWIDLIPAKYRDRAKRLADDVEYSMNGYFRAQSKVVFFVAVLSVIGFKIIDLPFAIVMGLLTGLLNYVPYLQIVAMIPSLLLGALHAFESGSSVWLEMGLVLLVFAVVQLAQDAYLTPKFMGDFSGFNPAIILLSLSVWGSLLGMIGLIIAIPLTSLLLKYYKSFIGKRKAAQPANTDNGPPTGSGET